MGVRSSRLVVFVSSTWSGPGRRPPSDVEDHQSEGGCRRHRQRVHLRVDCRWAGGTVWHGDTGTSPAAGQASGARGGLLCDGVHRCVLDRVVRGAGEDLDPGVSGQWRPCEFPTSLERLKLNCSRSG